MTLLPVSSYAYVPSLLLKYGPNPTYSSLALSRLLNLDASGRRLGHSRHAAQAQLVSGFGW
jgi:hypothetical protein